jgi:hypothetical protein
MVQVTKRYAKANNKYVGGQAPTPKLGEEAPGFDLDGQASTSKNLDGCPSKNYIMYLDANNLYGLAMSQELPVQLSMARGSNRARHRQLR